METAISIVIRVVKSKPLTTSHNAGEGLHREPGLIGRRRDRPAHRIQDRQRRTTTTTGGTCHTCWRSHRLPTAAMMPSAAAS